MKSLKTLFIFILIAFLVTLLSTCKKDIVEVKKYDADIILNDNVVLIDSTIISEPLAIEGDIFKFKNDGTLPSIVPGDVFVVQTNGGYIRKIVSIDYSDGEIMLKTTQAALTDVFEKLFISDTIKLDFENMKAYTEDQEAPIRVVYTADNVELKSSNNLINLNNTVLFNQTINNTQVFAQIIEGTVDFEPDIIRHVDLNKNFLGIPTGINSLTLGATGALSFNCLAEVILSNALVHNKELNIASFDIGPFWLGIVPLYINLGFDAGIVLNFDAACSLEAGFDANASVTFGAQYQHDNGWSTLWNKTLEANQLPTVWNGEASTNAVVYVKPSIGISIANAIGPYMDVKPDLVFNGEIDVPLWNYDLVGGLDGTLGFQVEIFSFTLANYNTTLFRYQKTIASQSGMMMQKPSLTTNIISEITNSSAKTGGVITSNGGSEIIAKGVCWSLNLNNLPDITGSHTNDGQGDMEFISDITELTANKTYFVRAYATNSKGTGYGNVRMFLTNTDPTPPVVVTGEIENITTNFASVSCEVTSDGGAPVIVRGICYSTNPNPTINNSTIQSGNGTGSYTVNISGLNSNTKYYVKAYAENSVDIAYGNQKDFNTDQESNELTAAFTAEPTNGPAPLVVQFEDKSSNNPTSWLWNFGDGQTSDETNPEHTYANPGTYTVKLTVENEHYIDFEQKNDYITVDSSFAINLIVPNGGEEWTIGETHQIQWDDNISENVKIQLKRNGTIVHIIANSAPSSDSYNWEIPTSITAGNNYRVNIQSVNNSNIYDESNGDFSILEQGNIIVTKPNPSTVWIQGQNEVIEWQTGDLGGSVKIELFKNNMQVETITNDTENNGSYTGYTVSESLAVADDYQVKITLIDNEQKFDFSDYFMIQEATQNQPPDKPSNPNPGNGQVVEESSVTLSWECTDPENDPLTFDVYAAKNNSNPTSLIAQGISNYSVLFSNLDPGATYYWKVVAKDDHQNVTDGDVWYFTTAQQGEPPEADFFAEPTSGNAPLEVNFTDQSTNNPNSWNWSFPGGSPSTSTNQNPTVTYNSAGVYDVTLTVENDFGSDTEVKNNYITVSEQTIPTVVTSAISETTQTSAIGGGEVTDQGSSPVTERGICYSTSPNPTTTNSTVPSGSGMGIFTSNITELYPGTTYYVRAYAINSVNTAYGDQVHFTTSHDNFGSPCPGNPTVTDIDGNTYQTVQIGGQCWMRKNLKTTKYRDGTSIDYPGSNNSMWETNTTGAYAWHNNNISNKEFLGALYNWHAVNNSAGLCPNGWHVPTFTEFETLVNNLGGTSNAGGKMKSTRTEPDPFPFWNTPNLGATNESGYTAYSAGYRHTIGAYDNLGILTYFWTSTEDTYPTVAYYFQLHQNSSSASNYYVNKNFGLTIRCLKNN
jgi:uncharacterized protein (TIGR02145 family)